MTGKTNKTLFWTGLVLIVLASLAFSGSPAQSPYAGATLATAGGLLWCAGAFDYAMRNKWF